mmetsp:Transcript_24982/g.78240  ORF Transcript_24982/g.78240 Transcript_24982/m.78240 type:complete len:932 (-) Transcript_24982:592-3387(-)
MDEAFIYAGSSTRGYVALHAANGTEAWLLSEPSGTYGKAAYDPVNETLYVPIRSKGIYAVEALTGAVAWIASEALTDSAYKVEPKLSHAGDIVVVQLNSRIAALRTSDGSELWSINGAATADSMGSPFAFRAGDEVIYISYDGGLTAYNITKTESIWEFTSSDSSSADEMNSPLLTPIGNYIFIASSSRYVYCVKADDGVELWKYRFGDAVGAPLLLSQDGTVLFVVSGSSFFALSTSLSSFFWKYALEDDIHNAVAVCPGAGTTYVASIDGIVTAIDDGTGELISDYIFEDGSASQIRGLAVNADCTRVFVPYDQALHMLSANLTYLGKTDDVPDGVGEGGPVVSPDGNLIFLGFPTLDDSLYAYDTDTLGEAWAAAVGPINRRPAVSPNGSVVVVTTTEGDIVALNVADGQVMWNISYPDAYAGNTVAAFSADSEYVYCGAQPGLYKVDASRGRVIWNDTSALVHEVISLSPDEDALFVVNSQGDITKVRATDGVQEWTERNLYCRGGVAVDPTGEMLFCGSYSGDSLGTVWSLLTKNASVIWSYETTDLIDMAPVMGTDAVYVGGLDNSLYKFPLHGPGPVLPSFTVTVSNNVDDVEVCGMPTRADGDVAVVSYDFQIWDADVGAWLWLERNVFPSAADSGVPGDPTNTIDLSTTAPTCWPVSKDTELLRVGTTQTLRVLAVTENGASPPSDVSISASICDTPSTVTDLIASATEDGSVSLSWTPIQDDGVMNAGSTDPAFANFFYDIEHLPSGALSWLSTDTYSGSRSLATATITSLERGDRAAFRVRVRNACDLRSPLSNVTREVSVIGVPNPLDPPTVQRNHDQGEHLVSWVIDEAADEATDIRVDMLRLAHNGDEIVIETHLANASTQSYVNVTTVRGVDFYFRVAVSNVNFWSEASDLSAASRLNCPAGSRPATADADGFDGK